MKMQVDAEDVSVTFSSRATGPYNQSRVDARYELHRGTRRCVQPQLKVHS